MKATVESPDPLHTVLKVELPWSMIAKELDDAYKQLSKGVAIKGFRKGKVPRSVLRQRYGRQVEEDVVDRMIAESYEAALIQHRVRAVSRPELEKGKFREGQPFLYTARVEIQPEVELKNTAIRVERETPEVTDEMVSAELTRLQEQNAVLTPIEGRSVTQDGDTAIVDYQASRDGKPIEGGEIRNHSLLIGSGKSVPGFEDQLLGMRVGEEKEFDITFPKDWGSGMLAGQLIHFHVTLNALKMQEMPRLDDEFAKDLGREGVSTLDELRAKVRADLLERENARCDREMKDKLIDRLIEENPVPVPPSLVERQQKALAQEVELFLAQQGMRPEQAGLSRGKMVKDMRERAEKDVKSLLLLNAIAAREKIAVGDDEIEKHMTSIAERAGQNLARVKALYDSAERKEELRHKIRQEKVLDYLLEVSKLEQVEEGEAPKPAGTGDSSGGGPETSGKQPTGEEK